MTKAEQLLNNRPKKKRRSKLKDKSLAKKYAWDNFSLYMRTKLCLQNTGNLRSGFCYTCNKPCHISDLQAGHFIDSRSGKVLFAEELIRLQCYGCNVGKNGNKVEYTLRMLKELGANNVNKLVLKYQLMPPIQYKLKDYLEIGDKYKLMYERLL